MTRRCSASASATVSLPSPPRWTPIATGPVCVHRLPDVYNKDNRRPPTTSPVAPLSFRGLPRRTRRARAPRGDEGGWDWHKGGLPSPWVCSRDCAAGLAAAVFVLQPTGCASCLDCFASCFSPAPSTTLALVPPGWAESATAGWSGGLPSRSGRGSGARATTPAIASPAAPTASPSSPQQLRSCLVAGLRPASPLQGLRPPPSAALRVPWSRRPGQCAAVGLLREGQSEAERARRPMCEGNRSEFRPSSPPRCSSRTRPGARTGGQERRSTRAEARGQQRSGPGFSQLRVSCERGSVEPPGAHPA